LEVGEQGVKLSGKPVSVILKQDDARVTLEPKESTTVSADETITIEMR
jgi:hypothetical protein